MSKDIFDPQTSANPTGNFTQTGRSNEALRLAYVLLWNFSKRVSDGNPEKLDHTYFDDIITFKVPRHSKIEDPEPDYEKLMVDVQKEFNFFVNGSEYGENEILAIRDAKYLDALAQIFGDLDGIVGFILAGNKNCSVDLLENLTESDYFLLSRGTSTKERAMSALESKRNS
jgi:hypothetical protein